MITLTVAELGAIVAAAVGLAVLDGAEISRVVIAYLAKKLDVPKSDLSD